MKAVLFLQAALLVASLNAAGAQGFDPFFLEPLPPEEAAPDMQALPPPADYAAPTAFPPPEVVPEQGGLPEQGGFPDPGGLPQPEPLPQVQGETVQPEPPSEAERVKNPVAVFSGIDKITGRIHSFDVYIDETVQFGALQVTPRVCYSSPQDEAPRTDSFVEVDEITLDRQIRRIFSGWMFADSPGLNAVEHPVYDVWLKDCRTQSDVPPPASASAG